MQNDAPKTEMTDWFKQLITVYIDEYSVESYVSLSVMDYKPLQIDWITVSGNILVCRLFSQLAKISQNQFSSALNERLSPNLHWLCCLKILPVMDSAFMADLNFKSPTWWAQLGKNNFWRGRKCYNTSRGVNLDVVSSLTRL